jgi:hypothetical protein
VSDMSSYKLLMRLLQEQCSVVESSDEQADRVDIKASRDIAQDSLQSPTDPDAGYNPHKGKGYQVQVMETYCDEQDPEKKARQLNLITHVAVEPASAHDANAVLPAIESAQNRDLGPAQLLCDKAYGGDDNCQAARNQGVKIVAPVMGTAEKSHGLFSFAFNAQGEVTRCSQGYAPIKVGTRKNRHTAVFSTEHCSVCPFLSQCNVRQGKRRFFLHYDDKARRCAQRRAHEQTTEFKNCYRWRSGVEATMSAYDRRTGVKQLRVRGLKAVRFAAVLKAAGLNILRAAAVGTALSKNTLPPGSGPNYACNGLMGIFKERCMRWWAACVDFFVTRTAVCSVGV